MATKNETTETNETKTSTAAAAPAAAAPAAAPAAPKTPTQKEVLAGQGFFRSGQIWNLGVFQDVENLLDDPKWSGKAFHLVKGGVTIIGGVAVGKYGYNRITGYLAARAASKAVSHMMGSQMSQGFEAAAQAVAAVIE